MIPRGLDRAGLRRALRGGSASSFREFDTDVVMAASAAGAGGSAIQRSWASAQSGSGLDGCRIEEPIGRGGMGVVYRARQLDLDRDVAIKLIAPDRSRTTRARALPERGARRRRGRPPERAAVYGAGVADGRGLPRHALRARRRPAHAGATRGAPEPGGPPSRVALGGALDAIHRAGYVHRDVKPANVLLDQTATLPVSDFGLAKQVLTLGGPDRVRPLGRHARLRGAGADPGRAVDARTDVYALGGVPAFMLSGRVPFERESDEAKLWAHLTRAAAAAVGAPGRRAARARCPGGARAGQASPQDRPAPGTSAARRPPPAAAGGRPTRVGAAAAGARRRGPPTAGAVSAQPRRRRRWHRRRRGGGLAARRPRSRERAGQARRPAR